MRISGRSPALDAQAVGRSPLSSRQCRGEGKPKAHISPRRCLAASDAFAFCLWPLNFRARENLDSRRSVIQAIPFAGLRSGPRLGGGQGYRPGSYRQTGQSPGLSGFGAHGLLAVLVSIARPVLVFRVGKVLGRGLGAGRKRPASGVSPYPRGEPVGNRAASPKHCKRPVVHRRRREAAAARWVRAWPGAAWPVFGDKPSGEGVAVGNPFLSVGKWWPGRWPLGQSQRDQGE